MQLNTIVQVFGFPEKKKEKENAQFKTMVGHGSLLNILLVKNILSIKATCLSIPGIYLCSLPYPLNITSESSNNNIDTSVTCMYRVQLLTGQTT